MATGVVDVGKGMGGRLRRLARRPEGGFKTGVEDLEIEDGRGCFATSCSEVCTIACSGGGMGVGDACRARPPCPARDFDKFLMVVECRIGKRWSKRRQFGDDKLSSSG